MQVSKKDRPLFCRWYICNTKTLISVYTKSYLYISVSSHVDQQLTKAYIYKVYKFIDIAELNKGTIIIMVYIKIALTILCLGSSPFIIAN